MSKVWEWNEFVCSGCGEISCIIWGNIPFRLGFTEIGQQYLDKANELSPKYNKTIPTRSLH
ncbi:MAG: hypothetical protein E6K94_02610 [Thaumarchaeota archaeon]|nr:MAG: hypothetical protein E6L01_03380 [Nitrososphaerota archaeon]TLX91660.1 MAG: hypothetical protein E6K94_02610 [Nitrososphaerota archaeon]